jgi:thioredoxin 1
MKILRVFSGVLLISAISHMATAQLIQLESTKQLEQLLSEKKPMVIDLFATWCGVCKRAEPMVERMAKRHSEINFIKIDGDKFPDLKDKYQVKGYPTFVFVDAQGKVVDRVLGIDEQAMDANIAKIRKPTEKVMPEKEAIKIEKKPEAKPMPAPAKKVEVKKPELKAMPCPEEKKAEIKTIPVKPGMDKNLVELESMKHLEELKAHGMPMMFDVYTTWCGPCKMMKPIVEKLSQEYTDVIFVTINAEKPGLESINRTYGVEAYPTFVFFNKEGKEADRLRGSGDEMLLKSKLGKISSKKTNVIVMDEKDMMAKMQAEQKMMPPAQTMKNGGTMMPTNGKVIESKTMQSKKSTRRGMYRH